MDNLILIYSGSDSEAGILKHQLDAAGIPSMLKSEVNAGHIAGFGAFGSCKVYINPDDQEQASEIVETFQA